MLIPMSWRTRGGRVVSVCQRKYDGSHNGDVPAKRCHEKRGPLPPIINSTQLPPHVAARHKRGTQQLKNLHSRSNLATRHLHNNMSLLLETTFGDLVLDLDVDGSPALCKNILKLAKARYYTNALIYNIVPGKFCQLGGE